ncbi:MAG: peptide chain release factor N(5)-glutamine methyltransferase [Pseudomonadota bacterium]
MAATRREQVAKAAARLREAGIEAAGEEARRLARHAWSMSAADWLIRQDEAAQADDGFEALIARRARREPLSQLIGLQAFWTLELEVTGDVLTPRSDTETLVETALCDIKDKAAPLRILDIATGSGAILLALLDSLPNASGIGTDLSAPALAVAGRNAQRCGLAGRARFVRCEWADAVEGRFDILVCNPPYIASTVIDTLDPEVSAFEPRLALDGGPDGLHPYRRLLGEARALLRPGGQALFEIGFDQGEAVLQLARRAGLDRARIVKDLGGRDRVLVFSGA